MDRIHYFLLIFFVMFFIYGVMTGEFMETWRNGVTL